MDESALVHNVVNGDRNAFDTLAGNFYVPLTLFASRITGSSQAAEDIVQDAFVHIWEHRRRLRNVAHVRNYLYLLVHNYAVDHIRASAKNQPLPGKLRLPESDVMADYIRIETSRLLYSAIEALPPRTSQIIRLTLEGVKQEHIASQMGITLATVKAQKSDGIRKLRALLRPLLLLLPNL